MPYRNIEDKRKYDREWARRKRSGQITRLTQIPSKEESHKRMLERQRKYNLNKRKYLEENYGKQCCVCHEPRIMIIHRKDGQRHKLFTNMSFKELREEVEKHKDEYVRVCGICHTGIHWAMKYLNLKWEDISTQK